MATNSSDHQNVKVLVQTKTGDVIEAKFTDCIMDLLGCDETGEILAKYKDNCLRLNLKTPDERARDAVTIKHIPDCPFRGLKMESVSAEDKMLMNNRHVSVATSVLVQSSDGYILLCRRALHMRTYPGLWVPPGGHIESGESLDTTVCRELQEETGLHIDSSKDKLSILCLWESAYPFHLSYGNPVRHHIVIYFLCKMAKDCTTLQNELQLSADEVSLAVWLNRIQVNFIIQGDEEGLKKYSPSCSVTEISPTETQIVKTEKISEIFTFTGPPLGRITRGTLYALEQLCRLQAKKRLLGNAHL